MSELQRGHEAYVLRLWEARVDGQPVWRASLQSPQTGERHAFASLDTLFTYLEERTRADASGSPLAGGWSRTEGGRR